MLAQSRKRAGFAVHSAVRGWRSILGSLLDRPDTVMLEVGAGGELLVARIRVVIGALILLLPLANWLSGGSGAESAIGLVGALLVNAFAHVWLALARAPRRRAWLPFATAAFDVSATTLVLALLAISDRAASINSVIVWFGYLLAIAMTALRNDGRVTLLSGALAIAEYALLCFAVFASVDSPQQLTSIEYGSVSASNAIQRILVLVMMTLIVAMIVYRMQRLVSMSGSDTLTGLSNRTWLVHRAPRLIDDALRAGAPLSLAMLDLDHFKRINDYYGHAAGDAALRHVATFINDRLRAGETLSRLGGEEFVLLLDRSLPDARDRVEILRVALAASPFVPDDGLAPAAITFSAGVAAVPQDGSDLSSLLRCADQRLRNAKRQGRNRVLTGEHES